jgi:hypothetical protein
VGAHVSNHPSRAPPESVAVKRERRRQWILLVLSHYLLDKDGSALQVIVSISRSGQFRTLWREYQIPCGRPVPG